MKRFLPIFIVMAFMLISAGPQVKMITITVINECDWDVPVGVGRDVNTWWMDEKEEAKIFWTTVPARRAVNIKFQGMKSSNGSFWVKNETTGERDHERGISFVEDVTVRLRYDTVKMAYSWVFSKP